MISEEKKKGIEQEARNLLKNFSKSLGKVKLSEKRKNNAEVGGFRKEVEGEKCDADFRRIMFQNAPNKNDNCIIAEKKEW
jgi:hypothetical protein